MLRFLLSTEDLNSRKKYVKTADTCPISLLYSIDVKIPLIDTVCAGHAHIGEYYKDFNIPEDPSCPCGKSYQMCIHIITECPLYKEHRHILHNDEQNIILTNLFGTKEGITRYTEFLTKTNTFAWNTQD
jgi:hypothetical protein